MNFKLRAVKGRSRKLYKEWRDGPYRIVWTKEVLGVRVPPHFFSLVRVRLQDGREMWDFVGRRGSYKTFKRAVECAEKHKELWTEAIEAKNPLKVLEKMPTSLPLWVKDRRLFELAKVSHD